MTPRNYLSWSQYNTFQKSPKTYKRLYILGEDGFSNKYTRFGKHMALIREGKERAEDEMIESIMAFLPQYPRKEYEMTAQVKIDRKLVTLLGIPDGVDFRKHIIGEDKTGLKWTQKMADKLEQLTWNAYIYYLNKKKIPKLQLNWIETQDNDGVIVATGNIKTFETTRTIQDFIKLQSNINKVWRGIVEMMESEWAGVV